jgi:integrase
MEFTVLTAVRTSEALNATWDEFDLKGKLWRISAERMKSDEAHEIPLSDRWMEILEEMKGADKFVFPAGSPKTALSKYGNARGIATDGRL